MIKKEPQYKTWTDERLKKAVKHLTEKLHLHQKYMKRPSDVFLKLIKTFREELTQRQKKISGGGKEKK